MKLQSGGIPETPARNDVIGKTAHHHTVICSRVSVNCEQGQRARSVGKVNGQGQWARSMGKGNGKGQRRRAKGQRQCGAQKTGEVYLYTIHQHGPHRMLTCERLDELPLHSLQQGESYIRHVHIHCCNLNSSEQFICVSI